MAFEQKEATFSAFKNTRKEKDTHPDLSGTLVLDGKHYWVSAWKKKDKNGDTFISGTVKQKESAYSKAKEAVEKTSGPAFDDSEIPF